MNIGWQPRWFVCVVMMAYPMIGYADIATNKKHEIDYLLQYTRESGCYIDIRGYNLTGLAASTRLHQQYQLYKDQIHSAEDFIIRTASRSRVVGRYSMVDCPRGDPLRTIDWLQRALQVYRLKRRF